jgi:NADH-quinone oxidoreductase subunit J
MMLDVDFIALRRGVLSYLPIGGLIGAILLVELLTIVGAWVIGPSVTTAITAPIPPPNDIPNTQALGLVLYTHYIYFFQAAGVILLVAMIGAIVLTLHHKPNVRRQLIAEQVARRKTDAIEVVKVKSGQGLP